MKITIDNKEVKVKKGQTVLDAARSHDIYIPTLCDHPQLGPYGGCRLCIVEIAGMRGFPAACTTVATEGMKVRTNTKKLQEMRREVFQLILSEHPSSCLGCSEAEECATYMETIRKVGVTTGCRWCPKDGSCRLQEITDYLEIKDVKFPIKYRNFPVEVDDPFFDRDYNLCIYCGRCVRICEEHRKSSVLTFKQRGQSTTIGPAFDLSHVEAGCEFCGACVSVCPTGALSEKGRKWSGQPDEYHPSFCPLCSLNCDIQILTRKGKLIGTLPAGEGDSDGGNLCVKGRFCLSDLVNHPDRILVPQHCSNEGVEQISWKDAARKVTENVKGIAGNRVAFYLSPDLALEEVVAAKQFAEKVLKTKNITSSVFSAKVAKLISLTEPVFDLAEIDKSDCIVSVFLDSNYNYAPVSLAVKGVAEKNIPYYKIGWTEDTTSRFAKRCLTPLGGREKEFFNEIIQALQGSGKTSQEIKGLAEAIKNSSSPVIILGTWVLDLTQWQEILEAIEEIKALSGCKIFAPLPYGNLSGMLSVVKLKPSEEINQKVEEGKIDALFMVGECGFVERPGVKFIVYQNSFPAPEEFNPDVILPAAMWPEMSGSYADMKGKRKKFKATVTPPGQAIQHQQIFAKIAKAMGNKNIKFTAKKLSAGIPEKLTPKLSDVKRESITSHAVSAPNKTFPYLLVQESLSNVFCDMSLSKAVADMAEIAPEEAIVMNPQDGASAGFCSGDSVLVESKNNSKVYPVMLRKNISPGFVYLVAACGTLPFNTNPCPVRLRSSDV